MNRYRLPDREWVAILLMTVALGGGSGAITCGLSVASLAGGRVIRGDRLLHAGA
jgi:hypothetical protein